MAIVRFLSFLSTVVFLRTTKSFEDIVWPLVSEKNLYSWRKFKSFLLTSKFRILFIILTTRLHVRFRSWCKLRVNEICLLTLSKGYIFYNEHLAVIEIVKMMSILQYSNLHRCDSKGLIPAGLSKNLLQNICFKQWPYIVLTCSLNRCFHAPCFRNWFERKYVCFIWYSLPSIFMCLKLSEHRQCKNVDYFYICTTYFRLDG